MKILIKILIGCALLYVVLSNTPLKEVVDIFQSINIAYALAAILLTILNIFIASIRWHLLIPKSNFTELLRSNFVFTYYLIFLPGQLVSEAIKGARLMTAGLSAKTVFTSIFIDKLVSFSSILLLGVVGLRLNQSQNISIQSAEYILIAMLIAVIIFLVYGEKALKLSRYLLKHSFVSKNQLCNKLATWIEEYEQEYIDMTKSGNNHLLQSFLVGLCFQLVFCASNYLISLSLGISSSYADWLWITSLLAIILLLPISIGGIGVREGGLAAMFSLLALPISQALSFSLVMYAMTIINALIGYLVDLFVGIKSKTSD